MLLMRYGLGVLGMMLAVLAVSHPRTADCGTGCGPRWAAGGMSGAIAGGEVGELLPSLVALLGLSEWPPWGGPGLRATATR